MEDARFRVDCPFCGAPQEGHARVGGHDASIFHADALFMCAYCAAPALMQEDQTLRLLTVEQARALMHNREAVAAILALILGGRNQETPKFLRWVAPDDRKP